MTKLFVKKTFRSLFPILLGGLILYYIYRDTDFPKMWLVLSQDISYSVLLFSLIFGLLANLIRGLRWHLMIKPIAKEQGLNPHLRSALYTVLGSYTINMIIPRGGEFWRCITYSKHEGISFSKLLGTLFNDRFADVIVLGIISFITLVWQITPLKNILQANPILFDKFQAFISSHWFYLFIILACFGLLSLILIPLYYPNNRVSVSLKKIYLGIISLKDIDHKVLFIAYSFAIWLAYFLFFYIAFFAFPFTANLPFSAGCLAFVLSSFSVVAPVQGGLGAWHYMVIISLFAFGVSRENAGNFAFIVYLIQTLWIILTGWLAILFLDSRSDNREKSR